MNRYIVDIVPAANWYAVYSEEDGSETFSPLAGRALYDSNDLRWVAGLVADGADKVAFCDQRPNFVGYRYWAGLSRRLSGVAVASLLVTAQGLRSSRKRTLGNPGQEVMNRGPRL